MLQYRSQKIEIKEDPRGARASCLVTKGLLPEHSMLSNFMLSDSSRWAPVTWGGRHSRGLPLVNNQEFSVTSFWCDPPLQAANSWAGKRGDSLCYTVLRLEETKQADNQKVHVCSEC